MTHATSPTTPTFPDFFRHNLDTPEGLKAAEAELAYRRTALDELQERIDARKQLDQERAATSTRAAKPVTIGFIRSDQVSPFQLKSLLNEARDMTAAVTIIFDGDKDEDAYLIIDAYEKNGICQILKGVVERLAAFEDAIYFQEVVK